MAKQRTNAYFLKLSSFFSGLSFYTPIVPLYFLTHGVNLTVVVLAQAFYSTAVLLFEVPTGVLADRFGHRRSVVISTLMSALGMLLVLVSPTVITLFVSNALFGLGEALQSGSKEALLFEGTQAEGNRKDYKKHLSHLWSYDNLAFAIGTATVGLLYGHFKNGAFTTLIVAAAIAQMAAFIVNLRLKDVVGAELNPFAGSSMWHLFKSSLGQIRQDSFLRNITYTRLLTLPAVYVVYGSYQAYFKTNGVSPYFIGFALTLGGLANALCLRLVHRLEMILSLDKAMLYLNILLGLTYLCFSVVHAPWLLVTIYVFMQTQYNLQEPIVSDYINDRTTSGIRASVLSGVSLIRQVGNTGSKVLLGLSLTPYGITGMLKIQAVYLVVGAFFSYWLLVRCGCTYRLSYESTTS